MFEQNDKDAIAVGLYEGAKLWEIKAYVSPGNIFIPCHEDLALIDEMQIIDSEGVVFLTLKEFTDGYTGDKKPQIKLSPGDELNMNLEDKE